MQPVCPLTSNRSMKCFYFKSNFILTNKAKKCDVSQFESCHKAKLVVTYRLMYEVIHNKMIQLEHTGTDWTLGASNEVNYILVFWMQIQNYCHIKWVLKKKMYHISSKFIPLMSELNPSEQRCLPEFFTGDFKF
jgi:hypothetical protein